jgi:hypothetical protein
MAARKAYQNIKQGSFESLAQYSERFRETYRAFQDSSVNKLPVEEADQAMDFFMASIMSSMGYSRRT